MNRPFRTRIGGLLVVAGLTGLARSAAADPIPTLPIVLQVAGHGNVPLHIVALAKAQVTRIYRDAGVKVVWIDAASSGGRSHPLQSSGTSDPGFALVVLPRELTDQPTIATDALGVAIGTRDAHHRDAAARRGLADIVRLAVVKASRLRGGEGLPGPGDTFEGVHASFGETDARPGDEVGNGPRA